MLRQHFQMLRQHFQMLHLVPKAGSHILYWDPAFWYQMQHLKMLPQHLNAASILNSDAAFSNAASMYLNHMHIEILKDEFWPMGSQHLIMWLGSKPIRWLHFQKKQIWSLKYWIQSQHLKCCGSIFKCCINNEFRHSISNLYWIQTQHLKCCSSIS